MKLITGLGNPGPAYGGTPHNMGYRVANLLAKRMGVRLRQDMRHRAMIGKGRLGGNDVCVLKPTTYMNLSGEAVAHVVLQERIRSSDIIVLLDDIDLPLGTLRWRAKGGDGGHKGLRSVIQELECESIARLRIGIAPEEKPEDLESYVLTPFGPEEEEWAEEIARAAADSLEYAIGQGLEAGANRFNGKRIKNPHEAPAEKE
jgi:PTH1 family peptidyl-tRNA hydrolase